MSKKNLLVLNIFFHLICHPTMALHEEPLVKTDPQTVKKFCENKNPNLIKEYLLPGEPSFWIKPFEIGGKLYFTGVLDYKTVIIEAETGKVTSIEGNQDPLVSFDNKILTSLTGRNGFYRLNFYAPEYNEGKINLKPYDMNIKIAGAYQSIAPLKTEKESTHYRLLIDTIDEVSRTTSPSILDMEKTQSGQLKVTGKFHNPCTSKKLQTPFLSKDGKMFAALNLETQSTQVFDISSGKCELKTDLGFITGKADFNFDGTQIAFHMVGVNASDRAGWVQNIAERNWSNIFVYDLNTKKFKQVTQNKTENSYYPVFLKDGTILHINSKTSEIGKTSYSVGISKNPMTETFTTEASVCLNCTSVNVGAQTAIGQLLVAICGDPHRGTIDSSLFIMRLNNLNKKDCENLINQYWSEKIRDFLVARYPMKSSGKVTLNNIILLKKEDLLASCLYR